MAFTAAGRLDGYYDEGGFGGPWDVAAGVILVEEAHGIVRSIHGGPFVLRMGKGAYIAIVGPGGSFTSKCDTFASIYVLVH